MQDWRAKALEYFPDLRELIEQESGPMGLWIELYHTLLISYEKKPIDDERIGRIYDYAAWCFDQPETGSVETDPSSAVAVSFVEDIPLNQSISDDLHRWMSVESFDGFENLFRYHLSDEQYQKFATDFREKKRQFKGPSRL